MLAEGGARSGALRSRDREGVVESRDAVRANGPAPPDADGAAIRMCHPPFDGHRVRQSQTIGEHRVS